MTHMRDLAARAYFYLSLGLGRLLRAGRYSNVRIVDHHGDLEVRKKRSFYAPLLVALGDPLVRLLDTGVRVLPQWDWVEHERLIHGSLRSASIRADADGTLLLPYLTGTTLAALLESAALGPTARQTAIRLAVVALRELHALGFTHGDAMAENVMVDLDAGVAHWFDFETVHDPDRPMAWRRADDVRALLATTLLRTTPEDFSETLRLILDVYADEGVTPLLVASFAAVFRRPLPFHLGQAALSFPHFREIARLLRERLGEERT